MPADLAIRVPDLGGFDRVEVIEVLVQPGSRVELEDPLITLESDKAVMDIPAERAGVIAKILVKAGDRVAQGDLIGYMEPEEGEVSEDESPQPALKEAQEPDPTPESAPEPTPAPEPDQPQNEASPLPNFARVHASPAVRRQARELGADLNQVSGSGPKGRILQEDLANFVKARLQSPGLAASPEGPEQYQAFGPISTRPLGRIAKKSAHRLQQNWAQVPLVTHFDEADVTETEAFRQAQKAAAAEAGTKLTLLPLVAKACARALQEFPLVNASLDLAGQRAILKGYRHLGFAVDTKEGLVVVVVRDLDKKGLLELAKELEDKAQRARQGQLKPEDVQGASFTLSNLGAAGGTGFTPLPFADNVGILGLSRTRTAPLYQEGQWVPRQMLPLSFSYDHRLIDGALAARFTRRLCELITDLRLLLM